LGVTPSQLALLAVLMLRGPQTAGELRARSERLYPFPSGEAVDQTLGELAGRELVERLPKRPGEREERWTQLLGAEPVAPAGHRTTPHVEHASEPRPDLEERVARLERE